MNQVQYPAAHSSLQPLLIVLTCLTSGAVLIFALLGYPFQAVGVTLLALVAVPYLIASSRGKIDWCEPIYIYSAVFFLTYVGSTIFLSGSEWKDSWYVADYASVFELAASLAVIGYAGFLAGYYSRWPAKIASRLPVLWLNPRTADSMPLFIAIVYAIGWMPRLVLLSRGQHLAYAVPLYIDEMQTTQATFNYLAFCAFFGYTLTCIYCAQKMGGIRWGVFLGIILPAELIYGFLSGSKLFMIPILIGPVFAFNYVRQRVPIALFAVPWLLFVFVVVPFNVAYRNSVTYGDFRLGTVFTDLPRIATLVSDELYNAQPTGSVELTVHRSAELPILAAILQNVPSAVPLQYGRTLFMIPAAIVIPTALWPTKYDFINESLRPFWLIWDQTEDSSTGVAITQIGELYFNFHIPGVIIGMACFGVFMRTYYEYFTRARHPIGLLIYISMWPFLGPWAVESWAFAVINFLVKNVTMMLVIGWFINKGRLIAPTNAAAVGKS